MDREALKRTEAHYDRHAGKHNCTEEALRARRDGEAAPLKHFHNKIKREMINRFAWQADSLLDFACGRGGDLQKWFDAGVRYVKGIDLSPREVEEAQRRYASEKALPRRRDAVLEAEFLASPELGLSVWQEPREYEAVTCMFALHYFFASEKTLHTFLGNVARNLKPGGYFFGTVASGRRVQDIMWKSGQWPKLRLPLLALDARWVGDAAPFGCAYNCAIGDTVTQGILDANEGSLEYLVYSSALAGVAAQHGLTPVTDWGAPELEDFFDEADRGKLLKHFRPRFPPACDRSLAQASSLFAAFALQKSGVAPRAGGASAKRAREEAPHAPPSTGYVYQPLTAQPAAPAAAAAAGGVGNGRANGGSQPGTTAIGAPPAAAAAPAYKRPRMRGADAQPAQAQPATRGPAAGGPAVGEPAAESAEVDASAEDAAAARHGGDASASLAGGEGSAAEAAEPDSGCDIGDGGRPAGPHSALHAGALEPGDGTVGQCDAG